MTDAIIVALISLIGTGCGSYFANRKNTALIAYRLEQLERKVEQHNQVIDRTYKLESRADVLEEKVEDLEQRS